MENTETATSPNPSHVSGQSASGERAALSARTELFYARDWAVFAAWCRGGDIRPLPADRGAVAAYLAAATRLGPSGKARSLAAIGDRHRRAGFPSPKDDSDVRAVLAAARAKTPKRSSPPTPGELVRMAHHCPGDLTGLRDRALLLLMASTGLGRDALLSIDAEFLSVEGPTLTARTGADGAGAVVTASRGERGRCPVEAVEDWLRVSDTSYGPVFRKIDRWGTVESRRLGPDAIRRILARRAPNRRTGWATPADGHGETTSPRDGASREIPA